MFGASSELASVMEFGFNFLNVPTLWPRLGPSLTTSRTSCFLHNVMYDRNGPRGAWLTGRILKVTHRKAAPGAKCDVYDCLVRTVHFVCNYVKNPCILPLEIVAKDVIFYTYTGTYRRAADLLS